MPQADAGPVVAPPAGTDELRQVTNREDAQKVFEDRSGNLPDDKVNVLRGVWAELVEKGKSKWKIGLNGYYDVKNGDMQSLTASISRDLHCWQMSINVTPIGYTHFFSITINPKSAILQDLKVNRTKYFYNE